MQGKQKPARRARRGVAFMVAAGLLSGCTVGPQYHPDRMKLPSNWVEHPATPDEIRRTNHEMQDWWNRFNDPVLSSLVAEAIKSNNNLKIMGQRILASRALRDQSAADWYPQVDIETEGGHMRFSSVARHQPFYPPGQEHGRLWDGGTPVMSVGTTASWQLDVFGTIQKAVTAQSDLVGASIEQRRAFLLTMVSDLVTAYSTYRATQMRLRVTEDSIKVARHVADIARRQYDQGTGTSLQLSQALAELTRQEASRYPLLTALSQTAHTIDALLGRLPGSTQPMLGQAELPKLPELPVTLPSIVFANRPDIRMAERQYAAATARIGMAVSALYPKFTLPLSLMPQAATARLFFNTASVAWQAVMLVAVPFFHGGGLTASVRAAQAEAEAARLHYRQVVLDAFRDVEDALSAWGNDLEKERSMQAAVISTRLAARRSRALYQAGLTPFINVLDSERTALDAQTTAILARQARVNDAIALYTALGAGWQGAAVTHANLPVSLQEHGAFVRAFQQ